MSGLLSPARQHRRCHFVRCVVVLGLLVMLPFGLGQGARAEGHDLWQALATPGHVALVRHALAPGTGDPEHFDLNDCASQRNLSAAGRRQARMIGDLFRQHGMDAAAIHSSQWCRCLETAEELGLGRVHPLPVLNSFFRRFDRRVEQTAGLRAWLADAPLTRPTVLVTHQVNITALSGHFPSSGEIVVLRRNADRSLALVGTLETIAFARAPR